MGKYPFTPQGRDLEDPEDPGAGGQAGPSPKGCSSAGPTSPSAGHLAQQLLGGHSSLGQKRGGWGSWHLGGQGSWDMGSEG